MITVVPSVYLQVEDYTIDPTASLTGGPFVPVTRLINVVDPLMGGQDLNSDVTLSIHVFNAVAYGTVPPSGGSPNDFLCADATWKPVGLVPFSGTVDGIVTHNPAGVQGKYLKDDNTWGTSATAGVTSVTGVDPIVVSPTTGDAFVAVGDVGIAVRGVVPATGGADATKFLCATNPVSWAVPALANSVKLQAVTPGTADVGHAHITGTMMADGALVSGSTAPVASKLYLAQTVSDPAPTGYVVRHSADAIGPSVYFRKSRGTEGAPAALANNDELSVLYVQGRTTGGTWAGRAAMAVKADGAALATDVPTYLDIFAGSTGSFLMQRNSSAGARFESGLSSIVTSDRALHTVDVQGTFGIKPKILTVPVGGGTYSYALLAADPSVILVDATNRAVVIGLLTAVGIAGRRYTFTALDSTNQVVLDPSGAQTINGGATFTLQRAGESVTIVSDGSNWWTESMPYQEDMSSTVTNGTPVANTVAETDLTSTFLFSDTYQIGSAFKVRIGGKYSTTGTPTLRMKFKNIAVATMADSGAITMPNTITDAYWYCEIETVINHPTTYFGHVLRATFSYENSTKLWTTYNMVTGGGGNPAGGAVPTKLTAQWSAADPANTIEYATFIYGMSPNTIVR